MKNTRRTRKKYIDDITETYNNFMKAVQSTSDKTFVHKIVGNYQPQHMCRSAKCWLLCNPAKMVAINYVINEIKYKGWDCKISGISKIKFDGEEYTSQNKLTIVCEMTK